MAGINVLAIILIVAFVLAYILFLYAIIQARTSGAFGWVFTVIAALFGMLLVGYLGANITNIVAADWAQILILLGLVTVTAMYARSTEKMAKEMREQRLSEARPYLLMRLEDPVKLEGDFDKLINAEKYEIPSNFKIKIRNEGTGPAINIIAAFWRSDNVFPFQPKGYLAPQEEWQPTISTLRIDLDEIEMWLLELREIVKSDYPGTIAIEYRDIHERTWVTYLQLQKYFLEENYIHIGEDKQSIVEIRRAKND